MTGSAKQSIARAVIASAAKQSILSCGAMDCFASLAMTVYFGFFRKLNTSAPHSQSSSPANGLAEGETR